MKNKKIIFAVATSILCIALFFYVNKYFWKTSGNCPEHYVTDEDINAEIARFISTYLKDHPNASIEKLGSARIDYLEKNKCIQTLELIESRGGKEAYVDSMVANYNQE